jgi:hypothetical protein
MVADPASPWCQPKSRRMRPANRLGPTCITVPANGLTWFRLTDYEKQLEGLKDLPYFYFYAFDKARQYTPFTDFQVRTGVFEKDDQIMHSLCMEHQVIRVPFPCIRRLYAFDKARQYTPFTDFQVRRRGMHSLCMQPKPSTECMPSLCMQHQAICRVYAFVCSTKPFAECMPSLCMQHQAICRVYAQPLYAAPSHLPSVCPACVCSTKPFAECYASVCSTKPSRTMSLHPPVHPR